MSYMTCTCGTSHEAWNFHCPITIKHTMDVEKIKKDKWIQGKVKIKNIPPSRCSTKLKNTKYEKLAYFRQPAKFFKEKNRDGTQMYYLTRNRRSKAKICNVLAFWQEKLGIAPGKKLTGKSARTTLSKNVIHDIGSEKFTEKQKSEFMHHKSIQQTYSYAGAARDHSSRADMSRKVSDLRSNAIGCHNGMMNAPLGTNINTGICSSSASLSMNRLPTLPQIPDLSNLFPPANVNNDQIPPAITMPAALTLPPAPISNPLTFMQQPQIGTNNFISSNDTLNIQQPTSLVSNMMNTPRMMNTSSMMNARNMMNTSNMIGGSNHDLNYHSSARYNAMMQQRRMCSALELEQENEYLRRHLS